MEEQELGNSIGSFIEALKVKGGFKEELMNHQDSYDELYSQGYHFYENGHYDKAFLAFHKLVLSHPMEGKYWFGLASTLLQQKNYEKALHAWSIAALIDFKNPLPHFHAAECLFSLKLIDEGMLALKEAKKRSPKEDLSNKIEALVEVWSKA